MGLGAGREKVFCLVVHSLNDHNIEAKSLELSECPTCMTRVQHVSQRLLGAGSEVEQLRFELTPLWDTGIPDSDLTHCTMTPVAQCF